MGGNRDVDRGRLADALTRAQSLLEDPDRWTRGALARSLTQQSVHPLSEGACRWSLSGALSVGLYAVLGPLGQEQQWDRLYDECLAVLWHSLPPEQPRSTARRLDVAGYNDHPTTAHEDVLALVERALSTLRGSIRGAA